MLCYVIVLKINSRLKLILSAEIVANQLFILACSIVVTRKLCQEHAIEFVL
jgi:hypothetical protein